MQVRDAVGVLTFFFLTQSKRGAMTNLPNLLDAKVRSSNGDIWQLYVSIVILIQDVPQ